MYNKNKNNVIFNNEICKTVEKISGRVNDFGSACTLSA